MHYAGTDVQLPLNQAREHMASLDTCAQFKLSNEASKELSDALALAETVLQKLADIPCVELLELYTRLRYLSGKATEIPTTVPATHRAIAQVQARILFSAFVVLTAL
jgi:hypothetical protein